MAKRSAGLLMYRQRNRLLEVLLVHPGGPFWFNKEFASWSIPKGEFNNGEAAFAAAKREFQEETGLVVSATDFLELGEVKQSNGKRITAWAFAGDCDPQTLHSNTFTLEYPPRSGKFREFPEVDRAAWFEVEAAKERIIKAQIAFLDELSRLLNAPQLSRSQPLNDPLMRD